MEVGVGDATRGPIATALNVRRIEVRDNIVVNLDKFLCSSWVEVMIQLYTGESCSYIDLVMVEIASPLTRRTNHF